MRRINVIVLVLLAGVTQRLPAQARTGPKLAEAFALERDGRIGEAITDVRALLESKSLAAPELGKAWNILGLAFEDQGDFAQAEKAYEQSIRIFQRLPNHTSDYAMVLDDLGGLYLTLGYPDIALKTKVRTLHLYEKVGDHTGMAIAASDLAGLALSQKRVRDARKFLEKAEKEELLTKELDSDNLAAISSMQGWLARLEGDDERSLINYQRSLGLWKGRHGEQHSSTGWGYVLVGNAEAELGRFAEALADMQTGLTILDLALGRRNPQYLKAEIAYSLVLDRTEAHAEAARIKATAEQALRDFYRDRCASCSISVTAFR